MQSSTFLRDLYIFVTALSIVIILASQENVLIQEQEFVDVPFTEFESLLKADHVESISLNKKELKARLKPSKELKKTYSSKKSLRTFTHEIDDTALWVLFKEAQVEVNLIGTQTGSPSDPNLFIRE